MGHRKVGEAAINPVASPNQITSPPVTSPIASPPAQISSKPIEFFVKWQGKAHIHDDWISEKRLDRLSHIKLRNYRKKISELASSDSECEIVRENLLLAQEEYTQVDRILASRFTILMQQINVNKRE